MSMSQGGAVAIYAGVANSHILFPVYIGLRLWAGLYLRDERLRALFTSHR